MTSWSSIMEKKNTLLNETIHITFGCVVHLHGHWDKVVPHMKPSILADLSNGVKFHNCICWLTNDIWSHYLSCWISDHHINNEDMVLSGHVKINLTHSQLLKGFKCGSKWNTAEEGGVGACSLTHNTLKGRGACWSSEMGLGRVDKLHSLTQACTQPTQSG